MCMKNNMLNLGFFGYLFGQRYLPFHIIISSSCNERRYHHQHHFLLPSSYYSIIIFWYSFSHTTTGLADCICRRSQAQAGQKRQKSWSKYLFFKHPWAAWVSYIHVNTSGATTIVIVSITTTAIILRWRCERGHESTMGKKVVEGYPLFLITFHIILSIDWLVPSFITTYGEACDCLGPN